MATVFDQGDYGMLVATYIDGDWVFTIDDREVDHDAAIAYWTEQTDRPFV